MCHGENMKGQNVAHVLEMYNNWCRYLFLLIFNVQCSYCFPSFFYRFFFFGSSLSALFSCFLPISVSGFPYFLLGSISPHFYFQSLKWLSPPSHDVILFSLWLTYYCLYYFILEHIFLFLILSLPIAQSAKPLKIFS